MDAANLNVPLDINELSRCGQVLARLYCRSICTDYRESVLTKYPDIAEQYRSVVSDPADFGSLLLDSLNDEDEQFDDLRKGIQLVCQNAMIFNSGSTLMENITTHVEEFAEGLFEEITEQPYRLDESASSLFHNGRRQKRLDRMGFILNEPLHRSEIEELSVVLKDARTRISSNNSNNENIGRICCMLENSTAFAKPKSGAGQMVSLHHVLSSLVPGLLEDLEDHEDQVAETKTTFVEDSEYKDIPVNSSNTKGIMFVEVMIHSANSASASEFVQPTLSELSFREYDDGKNNDDIKVGDNLVSFHNSEEMSPAKGTGQARTDCCAKKRQSSTQTILNAKVLRSDVPIQDMRILDKALGLFAVSVHERLRRGISTSSIWGRPTQTVWAQVKKAERQNRAPWFPAMVLCGGLGTEVPPTLSKTNWSRLPLDLIKPILRLRPKIAPKEGVKGEIAVANDNEAEVYVPEGHLLVEFFGTHDFGWVKADLAFPLPTDGKLPKLGSDTHKGKDVTIATINEALQIRTYLKEAVWGVNGEQFNDEEDSDVVMPTKAYLLSKAEELSNFEFESESESKDVESTAAAAPSRGWTQTCDACSGKQVAHICGKVMSSNDNVPPKNVQKPKEKMKMDFSMVPYSNIIIDGDFDPDDHENQNPPYISQNVDLPKITHRLLGESQINENEVVVNDENRHKIQNKRLRAKENTNKMIRWMEEVKPLDGRQILSNLRELERKLTKGVKRKISEDQSTPSKDRYSSSSNGIDTHASLTPDKIQNNEGSDMKKKRASANTASRSSYTAYSLINFGSSSFQSGQGIIHSRCVNVQSPIFFMESKAREARKALLRQQLGEIQSRLQLVSTQTQPYNAISELLK